MSKSTGAGSKGPLMGGASPKKPGTTKIEEGKRPATVSGPPPQGPVQGPTDSAGESKAK